MNLTIIAVGRMKKGPERSLWDGYAKRLRWPLKLIEVEAKNLNSVEKIKRKEAELLLSRVPKTSVLVALDQNGLAVSSVDFSKKIGKWQDNGMNNLALVVGGSDGLDKSVLDKAQLSISLGRMTWPHMMARIMLLEQLYRTQCILNRHPYHK
jgi:23S rRNA (pseudouridine1915-N3)-methyltransferase